MKTYPLYLNGQFTVTGEDLPVVNPATGEAFARMSTIGKESVATAIRDAHAAFASWKKVPGKGRGDFLNKVAGELHRRRDEISRIITMESGKPLSQSLGEVAISVDHLKWYAEEARRVYGRVVPPLIESKRHLVIKQPVGVVAAITPWNFPLMLPARKIGAAIAAGCPVILKPAPNTPLTAVALAECIAEAEPPTGVFQLVLGEAAEIAGEFLANPLCRKLTFTGSTRVGCELIRGAAPHVKPLSLELGGNAPVLVFEDCDLDSAVKSTMLAKFRNTGQSCIAANRIYVHRTVYPGFVQMLTAQTRELKLGDGLEPGCQVGPLINEDAVTKTTELVSDALQGGAKLLCGGKRVDGQGYFFEPTVLGDVARTSLCMFEELFAPVAAVTPFDTETEVIDLANNAEHGLAAYVYTENLKRALRLAEQLEAGMVGVNDGIPTASHCPFGGIKQSGWGRELGTEGIEAFMETKHISIGLE